MKHTIEGFSQNYALTLKANVEVKKGDLVKNVERQIDCTDLVILRWFVDFYPNMKKIEVDGKQYAWLTHKKLIEDLPIININKRSFIERMQKLVYFDILTYKFLKDNGGTVSLYGFGKNYNNLISDMGCTVEHTRGIQSNNIGVCDQTHIEDKSIINKSIKDNTAANNINNACEKDNEVINNSTKFIHISTDRLRFIAESTLHQPSMEGVSYSQEYENMTDLVLDAIREIGCEDRVDDKIILTIFDRLLQMFRRGEKPTDLKKYVKSIIEGENNVD